VTRLHLDYETRSECDLIANGLHSYARHPSTRALMLGWAIDDNPVQLWQPHEGRAPPELREAMRDPAVQKIAWNAPFEMAITAHTLKSKIDAVCGV
jgi:DNA polymerase